jgi:L-2-hydroxyglutarate oxidase LhgO
MREATVDSLPNTADFVVAGAGVVGLTVALELRAREPQASIVVLEKEDAPGLHASGRNSGVLHAGFYYTADSLKARFTRDGNRRMREWCAENGIPVRACGKLVVARDREEHRGLDELLRRGRQNGVTLDDIDGDEARRIEPRVRTKGRAIWSPTTAVVDPAVVMQKLAERARDSGIALCLRAAWRGHDQSRVVTGRGEIDAGYFVNAAGLYADRVARAYGFSAHHRMLPFKGLYLYGDEAAGSLACCVYPVPDLDMPFLGVHFTVTALGGLKIGPTALPGLWLEQYGEPSWTSRFSLRESSRIIVDFGRLLVGQGGIRRFAVSELRKMSRAALVREASRLLTGVDVEHFRKWGRPGIRAQLYNTETHDLVMDFCVEHDDRSLHVLNAVSPAFTCAFPFARHLVDLILNGAPKK